MDANGGLSRLQDACRLFVNSPPTMNRMAESVPSDDVATPSRPSGSAAAPTGPLWGAFAEPPPAERRAEFALPELPLPTFMKMQQQALQALHKVPVDRPRPGTLCPGTVCRTADDVQWKQSLAR